MCVCVFINFDYYFTGAYIRNLLFIDRVIHKVNGPHFSSFQTELIYQEVVSYN